MNTVSEASDLLLSMFAEVRKSGEPRMVSLESPSGWGKTYTLQEFYRELAKQQDYWPASLFDEGQSERRVRRKVVYPAKVDVIPGAQMPWMWWGLPCDLTRTGRPRQVLGDEITQLMAHQASLLARSHQRDALKSALGAIASFSASMFLPSVGDALGVIETTKSLVDAGKSVRARNSSPSQLIEADGTRRTDLTEDCLSLIRLMGKENLPVVIAIEDAHHADPGLLLLIDALVSGDVNAPVLVIATSNSETVAEQASSGGQSFGTQISTALDARRDRLVRLRLPAASHEMLSVMVRDFAPATGSKVVEALVARADGNPLVLESILSVGKVRRSLNNERIDLDPSAIKRLPHRYRDLLELRWRELDLDTQFILGIAALQGRRFLSDLVDVAAPPDMAEVNPELSLTEVAKSTGLIDEVELGFEFVENHNFELALAGLEEFLDPDEVSLAFGAIAKRLEDLRAEGGLRDMPNRALEAALYCHVQAASRAVALVEGKARIEAAAESLVDLGSITNATGKMVEYFDLYNEYLEALRTLEPVPITSLIRHERNLIHVCQLAGRPGHGIGLAEEALVQVAKVEDAEIAAELERGIRNNLGLCLGALGRSPEALKEAEAVLEMTPRDDAEGLRAALHNCGTAEYNLDRFEAAENRLRQAVSMSEGEGSANSLNELARSLGRQNRFDEAEAFAQQALRLLPETRDVSVEVRASILTNLGWILRNLDRARDAFAVLESAISLYDSPSGRLTLSFVDAAVQYERAGRAVGNEVAVIEVEIKQLRGLEFRKGPADHEVLALLSRLANDLYRNGRTAEAIRYCDSQIAKLSATVGEDTVECLMVKSRKASVLSRAGDTDAAIEIFLQIVDLAASVPRAELIAAEARGELALIAIGEGDVAAGLEHARGLGSEPAAIAGKKTSFGTWLIQVELNALVAADMAEDAIQMAREFVAEQPDSVAVRLLLVDALQQAGESDEALSQICETGALPVVARHPFSAASQRVLFVRADLLASMGLDDDAASILRGFVESGDIAFPTGHAGVSHARLRIARLLDDDDREVAELLSHVAEDEKANSVERDEARRWLARLAKR